MSVIEKKQTTPLSTPMRFGVLRRSSPIELNSWLVVDTVVDSAASIPPLPHGIAAVGFGGD